MLGRCCGVTPDGQVIHLVTTQFGFPLRFPNTIQYYSTFTDTRSVDGASRTYTKRVDKHTGIVSEETVIVGDFVSKIALSRSGYAGFYDETELTPTKCTRLFRSRDALIWPEQTHTREVSGRLDQGELYAYDDLARLNFENTPGFLFIEYEKSGSEITLFRRTVVSSLAAAATHAIAFGGGSPFNELQTEMDNRDFAPGPASIFGRVSKLIMRHQARACITFNFGVHNRNNQTCISGYPNGSATQNGASGVRVQSSPFVWPDSTRSGGGSLFSYVNIWFEDGYSPPSSLQFRPDCCTQSHAPLP